MLQIEIPNIPRSLMRIVLSGKAYLIGFEFNETADRWRFSLYTMQHEPIVLNLPIVPHFPLNLQVADPRMPSGVFGVKSNPPDGRAGKNFVGKDDFADGTARFYYAER
ncbi:MAG: hypothetical protein FWG65_09705 [Turicibacter sp.]|nr:hypothetical protein [Turicibacter sp.]